MSSILLWLRQQMALYLRNRGWVAFYLDKEHRECGDGELINGCWLRLYEETEAQEGR